MAYEYSHGIIKEEIIIPDFKEEPYEIYTNEPYTFSTDLFIDQTASKEHNTKPNLSNSTIIESKTKSLDRKVSSPSYIKSEGRSIDDDDDDQTVGSFSETNVANAPIAQQINLGAALKSLSKAHCSKCAEKSEVIARKARCSRCKTSLVYHCENCRTVYKTYSDLCYHLKWKHVKTATMIKCEECGKMFSYSKSLKEHQRMVHRIYDSEQQKKSLTCKKCGKTFALSTLAANHEKDCGKGLTYKCDKCSFTTNFKAQLIIHIKEKHSNLDMTCKRCKKVFKVKKTMERHWKIYCGKEKLFRCHHCGGKFYRKDEMRDHIRINHAKVYTQVTSRRQTRSSVY